MDICKDIGFLNLVRIKVANESIVPAYVADADLGAIKEAAEGSLCESEFAEPVGRQYPINSKAAVWLSAAYFAKTAEVNELTPTGEYILGNIKAAAELYGIESDVGAILSAYMSKQAEASTEIWGWEAGGERKYPLHTTDLTKTAMDYFGQNRDKYPFEMRRAIASNIYKQALAFNLEPSEDVRKEAGAGFPDRAEAIRLLEDRKDRIQHTDKQAAAHLESAILALEAATSDELSEAVDKCASVIEYTDKVAGFRYAGRGDMTKLVERPCDAFYQISYKQAEDNGSRYVKLNKTIIDCVKLAEIIPMEDLDAVFCKDHFRDQYLALVSAGKLDKSASTHKIAYTIISEMSQSDKNTLEAHLKAL
jgi:hypothetical protein